MNATEAFTAFGFYVAFVFVILVQIFLPCYFGSDLGLSANELVNANYHSNWIRQPVSYRRDMIFFMEYLKRPPMLRAGNYFPITRDTFVSVSKRGLGAAKTNCANFCIFLQVLNKSYGLFAVLQKTVK